MKIVIDISEDTYSRIKDGNYTTNPELGFAIQRGIVLDNGCGNLLDENKMVSQLIYSNVLKDDVKCGELTKILDAAIVAEIDDPR